MREVVLDTETTGLSFKAGHRLVEIGCVELINHVATSKSLQFYCSTNKEVDEGAQKVHGLTNEFLNKHPSFEDQHKNFLNFIKEDDLIIHNSDFDMGFINNELKLIGIPPLKNKIIDTVSLARKNLNTRVANLDYLCRRFSIDLSERNIHGALLDSQLLAEVYLELIGGKQISMNLDKEEVEVQEDIRQDKKLIDINTQKIFKVGVSEDELNVHKELLKEIKNSMWDKIHY
tara:strand:+ start:1612 stop:2304 length:693 start_codon:yes stop_codon:yes gene_type:complete